MTPVFSLTQIAYFAAGTLDDLTTLTGGDLRDDSLLGYVGGDYCALMNGRYGPVGNPDFAYAEKGGGSAQLRPIQDGGATYNGGSEDRYLLSGRSFTISDDRSGRSGGAINKIGHLDTPQGGGFHFDIEVDQKLVNLYWYGRSGAGSVFSVTASLADGSAAAITRSLPANTDVGYLMQLRTRVPTTATLQFTQTSATTSEIMGFAYMLPWVMPTRLKGLRVFR